jgi:hypothetical protein
MLTETNWEMLGPIMERDYKARIAAMERVISRHVKWREKALRYLCMVRDRAPGYRPLIENFIEASTSTMVESAPSAGEQQK